MTSPSPKHTLLIIDDDEIFCETSKDAFESEQFEVLIANNKADGLSACARNKIDVVLLDINMPGLSGIDVLGRISTDWPNLCVIMATAVAEVETGVEAMKLGAYDYITKPFDQDEALLKIRRAIEKWQERMNED